jgi:hypothetical protein
VNKIRKQTCISSNEKNNGLQLEKKLEKPSKEQKNNDLQLKKMKKRLNATKGKKCRT